MDMLTRADTPAPPLAADRQFRWQMLGGFMSMCGRQLTLSALPWLVLALTSNSVALGLAIAALELPRAAFTLVGGALVDRHSPKWILQRSTLASATLLAGLGVLAVGGAIRIEGLYLLAFAMGTVGAFSGPAAASLVPQTVPRERLQTALAIFMSLAQAATFLGPLMTGALLVLPRLDLSALGIRHGSGAGTGGLGLAFLFNAFTYLLAALTLTRVVRFIGAPAAVPGASAATGTAPTRRGMFAAIAEGAAWIGAERALRSLYGYWALSIFLRAGALQIGIPLLVTTQLHRDAATGATLMSLLGAGSIAGMLLSTRLSRLSRLSAGRLLFHVDLLVGAILAGFAAVGSPAAAGALLLLLGFAAGVVEVRLLAWIQARIPGEMRGRVMSFQMLLLTSAAPLSSILAGLFIHYVSTASLFVGAGAGLVLVALAAIASPMLRSMD
ncbi:MFS transporter [Burkholderia gladioli]|uniref:MFS transporter n=1 Tax=Burkholderia gladioli TaxID=28095 RepID=UPI001640ABDD|nr:MFS transporter [Burkholderia gladioli]